MIWLIEIALGVVFGLYSYAVWVTPMSLGWHVLSVTPIRGSVRTGVSRRALYQIQFVWHGRTYSQVCWKSMYEEACRSGELKFLVKKCRSIFLSPSMEPYVFFLEEPDAVDKGIKSGVVSFLFFTVIAVGITFCITLGL